MIGIGDYSFDGQFFARWDGAPFLAEDRRALRPVAARALDREIRCLEAQERGR